MESKKWYFSKVKFCRPVLSITAEKSKKHIEEKYATLAKIKLHMYNLDWSELLNDWQLSFSEFMLKSFVHGKGNVHGWYF